jgi:hypothetical protein
MLEGTHVSLERYVVGKIVERDEEHSSLDYVRNSSFVCERI